MAAKKPKTRFFLGGILPFDRKRLPTEIVAGITLAALGIPEVMGYTKIAGMPVITGLYTILVPISVFAVLGSSRHLVVGADSATAAIMFAGLAGLAAPGSPAYVELAGVLAVMVGGLLILARVVRLGFLADFLSRSVLIGFLTGVGIQVAMGQIGGMFGVPDGTGGTIRKFFGTLANLGDTSWATLGVTVAVLVVTLGTKRITKKVPGALLAVIGSIAVSYFADLASHGVATLGVVPRGLPSLVLPRQGWDHWSSLLPVAASIFLVILAQSAATSRAYAARYSEEFDEQVDLTGLSLANVSAALTGTFVVNGSPTKTQMVDGAGGRSQVSQLAAAVIVGIVLIFLTAPLQYLPEAVLSTVVFIIGIELVDIAGMRRVLRRRPDEFFVALSTAAIVVVLGVEQGIIVAIVLSVMDHLRQSYRPNDTLLVESPAGHIHSVAVTPGAPSEDLVPGLVVYRFGASLYYANANHFSEEVRALTSEPRPRWLCLDLAAVGDIDYSGGETLDALLGELGELGVRVVVVEPGEEVRAQLDRYGLTAKLGEDGVFSTVRQVVEAFQAAQPSPPAAD